MRSARILGIWAILAAVPWADSAGGATFQVGPGQTPTGGIEERFIFSATAERVRVDHHGAMYSCCLEFDPTLEIEGNVIRLVEIDEGPACRCPDQPWHLFMVIEGLAPGPYDVYVSREGRGIIATATLIIPETLGRPFVRGRVNADGVVDIADAIGILDALFGDGAELLCPDAGDANDDGANDIADAVYLLSHLFTRGPAPPSPYPDAGDDPTADDLACPAEDILLVRDFVPGDVTGDGQVDLSDCVAFVAFVTDEDPFPLACPDAADANDDGALALVDICPLCPAFCPGPFVQPPPPIPGELRTDTTPDRLGCW